MPRVKITVILFMTLGLCSCSRFDYQSIPLYDEVFVPQDKDKGMDTSERKPPPQNPR